MGPWDYLSESELRPWLLERVAEGYAFPLNPVWIVRDAAWYEVFSALCASKQARIPMQSWFPPSSGLNEELQAIHKAFPIGFSVEEKADAPRGPMESFTPGEPEGLEDMDLSPCERRDLALDIHLQGGFRRAVCAVRALTLLDVSSDPVTFRAGLN